MQCSVMEEKSRLYAISRAILWDESQGRSKSSNPDFEKRRTGIIKAFDKELERTLKKCAVEDWEEMQKDDYNLRDLLHNCMMYREDLDNLYFEMGFRCGFILWQDLTDTTGHLVKPPADEPEPSSFTSETEPPTIEEILQKDPDTLTMEEVGIIADAYDVPQVMEYYLKIPDKKKEERRSIERSAKWYDITWKNGEIASIKEKSIPAPEYKNLSPEKKRRQKIKDNYYSFHRDIMRDWCRKNGIKYIASED